MIKQNKKQFKIVSLMQKNKINIELWLCIIATALMIIGGIISLDTGEEITKPRLFMVTP